MEVSIKKKPIFFTETKLEWAISLTTSTVAYVAWKIFALISQAENPGLYAEYYRLKIVSLRFRNKLHNSRTLCPTMNIVSKKNILRNLADNEIDTLITKYSKKTANGVVFRKELVKRKPITDGLCSAISFHFIAQYLQSSRTPLSVQHLSHKYKDGAPYHIAKAQAIFNAIAFEEFAENEDHRKAKIQSMARCFDLNVQYASLVIKDLWDRCFLEQEMTKLTHGVFLGRLLKHEDNHKKERYGHSFVFLKEVNYTILFDPTCGSGLTKTADGVISVMMLIELYENFKLDEIRFYKISKTS